MESPHPQPQSKRMLQFWCSMFSVQRTAPADFQKDFSQGMMKLNNIRILGKNPDLNTKLVFGIPEPENTDLFHVPNTWIKKTHSTSYTFPLYLNVLSSATMLCMVTELPD